MTAVNKKEFLIWYIAAIVFLLGIFGLPYSAIDYIRHGLEKPMTGYSLVAFIFGGICILLTFALVQQFIRSLRIIARMHKQIKTSNHQYSRSSTADNPQDVHEANTPARQNKTSQPKEDK